MTAAASLPLLERRGISREAHLRRTLFRILGALDDTRPTGLMRVLAAEQEVGRLAVAGGRVCLAFAATAPAGPADDAHGPTAALRDLRQVAVAARTGGGSLCGAVLNSGREATLREALLDETSRSLVAMADACASGLPALELTPARDDYDERLLLGTSEAFLAALRARFRVAPEAVALALDGLQPGDAALLLVRSPEPHEQPYPVAQRGFGQRGLRHVVALTRLASALDRGRSAHAAPESNSGAAVNLRAPLSRTPEQGADTLPTPSLESAAASPATAAETWRCVASETRLVLLRAQAATLEQATARALRFVAPDGARRGVEMRDSDPATIAAAGLLASWAGEAPGSDAGPSAEQAFPLGGLPQLQGGEVPGGMIWPPGDGRTVLGEALADRLLPEPLADGSWAAEAAGRWRLHSHAIDVFLDAQQAHAALLEWARWHADARARLSPQRCIVAAPAGNETWRLWQVVHAQPTLRQDLERALSQPQAEQVARGLLAASRAFAEGLAVCASLGTHGSIDTLGSAPSGSVYVGLAPAADMRSAALDVDGSGFEARLRAEFGPLLAQAAATAGFDVPRVLRDLLPLASSTGQARVGEVLAVLLSGS